MMMEEFLFYDLGLWAWLSLNYILRCPQTKHLKGKFTKQMSPTFLYSDI